ncbi:hypothetical protein [Paenibacillus soyae]|uniref:Uncharacterized protein n=1 Tax=Paenibacillus soyae TaxID=2969249 RepID=A0A9X2MMH4_9BACL|nr:hypothetical protein [Paenibacillus soyae]MCR2802787.1 hypothetical protein [Paenibacillus soyae]
MMKRFRIGKGLWFSVILFVVLACSIVYYSSRSTMQNEIMRELNDIHSGSNEIIVTQIKEDQVFTLYEVDSHSIRYAYFKDKQFGLELLHSGGNAALQSDDGISWHVSERANGEEAFYYGAVLDPAIAQIVIINSGVKSAQIIEYEDKRAWFLADESRIKLPVHIRAIDLEGNVVYESYNGE